MPHETMKLLADSSLPNLARFDDFFSVSTYANLTELHDQLSQNDILLCRSTLRVTAELLQRATIQCVATASSGTDHLDELYLKKQCIQIVSSKGCNAHAVSDYVLACLAWLIQHHYLSSGPIGIIGCGEVGMTVSRRLATLGFVVMPYDPPRNIRDPSAPSCALTDLNQCAALLVHANLHQSSPYPSANLLDQRFFAQLKSGTVILNAARGGIVDEQALLGCQQEIIYCTDVYRNEPTINSKIVDLATLCTPHIAGHSIEGKANAVELVLSRLIELYGLASAIPRLLAPHKLPIRTNWRHTVLEYYNPETETLLLKQAANKTDAFLSLRAAHTKRHDFTLVNSVEL